MTQLLEQALCEVKKLPEPEQAAIASMILSPTNAVGKKVLPVRRISWRAWPLRCVKTSKLVGSRRGVSISCELATNARLSGLHTLIG
jgi:hypothetical protein